MVLAAGLGTRLRPLTDDRPKALVEVAGRTMLDRTLERLRAFGVREAIVNVFHFADLIVDYLRAHDNFGMRIEISREDALLDTPLDTGGGLKRAAWFFQETPADAPFLLHNVDILSGFDLARMLAFHREHDALATLGTQRRPTSRPLLFDDALQLRGRGASASESRPGLTALAFAGIHVVSPRIFARMEEQGAFSIVAAYLRLAAQGEPILAYRDDDAYWRDLGKPESVAQAAEDLRRGESAASGESRFDPRQR
jgi:NDP-sugar pyrophosphorylase family protein